MPNEEQQKKIQKIALDVLNLCRNCLVINLRFMDSAISRLTLTEGVTERTATDGENYYYDPVHILRSYKKARELPIRRYLHTVFHCIYRHMFIGTLKDNRLWDLACDMAVEHIREVYGDDTLFPDGLESVPKRYNIFGFKGYAGCLHKM